MGIFWGSLEISWERLGGAVWYFAGRSGISPGGLVFAGRSGGTISFCCGGGITSKGFHTPNDLEVSADMDVGMSLVSLPAWIHRSRYVYGGF